MADVESRTVSLASCKYNWDQVDKHAEELGLDRSKYLKLLIEEDMGSKRWFKLEVYKVITILLLISILAMIAVGVFL
jgi:hypothetical protein